ncbi:MAG: hypothetical protein KGL39_26865 [Patescibacteria group bacterium]|nr:hypothetical protein [Patescibacteria group bacterium]
MMQKESPEKARDAAPRPRQAARPCGCLEPHYEAWWCQGFDDLEGELLPGASCVFIDGSNSPRELLNAVVAEAPHLERRYGSGRAIALDNRETRRQARNVVVDLNLLAGTQAVA